MQVVVIKQSADLKTLTLDVDLKTLTLDALMRNLQTFEMCYKEIQFQQI